MLSYVWEVHLGIFLSTFKRERRPLVLNLILLYALRQLLTNI